MQKLKAFLAIALGALYLLNPGFGIFELIPDQLPFIGNLDEGAATVLIIWGWKRLRELKASQDSPK